MNAALLGLTEIASSNVLARAKTAPATGYRFQGFAPHEQDYEVSLAPYTHYTHTHTHTHTIDTTTHT